MSLELKSLLDLPVELIHHVLELLDAPSLLQVKLVSRRLATMIESSISLRYHIQLHVADLIDNPFCSRSKAERLRLLDTHQRAWNNVARSSVQEIPFTDGAGSASTLRAWELTNGTLGLAENHSIRFVQLPSRLRGISQSEWVIASFDFVIKDFAMDKSQDLLVVIERGIDAPGAQGFLRIHIRSLSTGKPHPHAKEPTISRRVGVADADPDWSIVQIYGSCVAVLLQAEVEDLYQGIFRMSSELAFCNWKTGSTTTVITGPFTAFAFLTEEQVVLAMSWSDLGNTFQARDSGSLEVIDITNAPSILKIEDLPVVSASSHPSFKWRSFKLPALSDDAAAEIRPSLSIHTNYSPAFSGAGDDVPFTTSPEDRLYVISFKELLADNDLVLFVRLASLLSLLEDAPSPRHTFPWEDWGPTNTRMVEGYISDTWVCCVHGLRAILVPWFGKHVADIWDFNQRRLRRNDGGGVLPSSDLTVPEEGDCTPVSEQPGYCLSPTQINPSGRDYDALFERDVITSLPCSIRPFASPDDKRDEQYFMMSEDSLVLVLDDEKFIIASF
ncbi:hypothetical protein LshimejAT787_1005560 [Lyophyllum shimeji]|uniref:F-box domain-containing protein n=1 Tax=Lyophyllum shimeji TaxID=47721 RepID=A0A9P3PVF9_LYOSH|nr:hypothetical protein LshimejAT787_1005560 [Lyophyllum shimeji]